MMLSELMTITSNFRQQDWRILTKYHSNPNKFKSYATTMDPIISKINEIYKGIPLNEAAHLLRNGLSDIPKCPICGNDLQFRTTSYSYPKYCSNQCRQKDIGNPSQKSIVINDIEFQSMSAALDVISDSYYILKTKLMDVSYPNYRFKNNHEHHCLELIEEIHPKLLDKQFLINWKMIEKR